MDSLNWHISTFSPWCWVFWFIDCTCLFAIQLCWSEELDGEGSQNCDVACVAHSVDTSPACVTWSSVRRHSIGVYSALSTTWAWGSWYWIPLFSNSFKEEYFSSVMSLSIISVSETVSMWISIYYVIAFSGLVNREEFLQFIIIWYLINLMYYVFACLHLVPIRLCDRPPETV